MGKDAIYVFHGYYDEAPKAAAPSFPDGTEYSKSFVVAAQTLGRTLQRWFLETDVHVRQSWTKEKIFYALEKEERPIRQVHIVAHGDASRLSLAYQFDNGQRLLKRARKFNAMKGMTDNEKAYQQWGQEDAVVAGYFRHYMDRDKLKRLKEKHKKDAYWHIWGCFCGEPAADLGNMGQPELDQYFKRFRLGQRNVDGIAKEIASYLDVDCTAAIGNGLSLWRRDPSGKVRKLQSRGEQPVAPFWLWLDNKSSWVTYDKKGQQRASPLLFQWTWAKEQLPYGRLPQWLVDAYGK